MTKQVLVTGAGSGIGAAIARGLAEDGHRIVLIGRTPSKLEAVAADIPGARVLPMDVSNPEADKLHESLDPYLPVVLINNAGIAVMGPFQGTSPEAMRSQIEINLLGPILLTHALLPTMLERGHGHVVNVLSIVAHLALPYTESYAATKAGLLVFGRALAVGHRSKGLRVTAVLPGATDTPIWDPMQGAPKRGDMSRPEDVAAAVRFAVNLPETSTVDELTITPPRGLL